MTSEERLFRCLSCDREFEVQGENVPQKCPFCRSRFLTLVRGNPLPRKGGCMPSG